MNSNRLIFAAVLAATAPVTSAFAQQASQQAEAIVKKHRESIKQLEQLRDTRPDDHDAIDAIAIVANVALVDWSEARRNLRAGRS